MKLLALLLSFAAFATPTGRFHLTGKVVALTDTYVEIKTGSAALLVPKELVPKAQQKSEAALDIEVSKKDLDRIKLKK